MSLAAFVVKGVTSGGWFVFRRDSSSPENDAKTRAKCDDIFFSHDSTYINEWQHACNSLWSREVLSCSILIRKQLVWEHATYICTHTRTHTHTHTHTRVHTHAHAHAHAHTHTHTTPAAGSNTHSHEGVRVTACAKVNCVCVSSVFMRLCVCIRERVRVCIVCVWTCVHVCI